MSLFDRIFGRRPSEGLAPTIIGKLVDLVSAIAATSKDRTEIRKRLAEAAHAGDLDFLIEGVQADKKKAQDFIDNG